MESNVKIFLDQKVKKLKELCLNQNYKFELKLNYKGLILIF